MTSLFSTPLASRLSHVQEPDHRLGGVERNAHETSSSKRLVLTGTLELSAPEEQTGNVGFELLELVADVFRVNRHNSVVVEMTIGSVDGVALPYRAMTTTICLFNIDISLSTTRTYPPSRNDIRIVHST